MGIERRHLQLLAHAPPAKRYASQPRPTGATRLPMSARVPLQRGRACARQSRGTRCGQSFRNLISAGNLTGLFLQSAGRRKYW